MAANELRKKLEAEEKKLEAEGKNLEVTVKRCGARRKDCKKIDVELSCQLGKLTRVEGEYNAAQEQVSVAKDKFESIDPPVNWKKKKLKKCAKDFKKSIPRG